MIDDLGVEIYNKFVIIIVSTMWSIVFYIDHRGKSPPLDFINSLPVMEQAKIRNTLRLLREFGAQLSMPHAKHIDGKLWELRSGGVRLFYFTYINQQFVILHGNIKKSNKAPTNEIELALKRMKELNERKE
jgi:phage-related protein